MYEPCEPCTHGTHEACTAPAGDCTNVCHPGYDSEAYAVPVSASGQYGREYALFVRGTGRGYLTTPRPEEATREAGSILAALRRDERWMARVAS